MNANVAVIIPYYHSGLSEIENISYRQCLKKLKNYPIILVVPESMTSNNYPTDEGISFEKVPSKWLSSVDEYNAMMLDVNFYKRFQQYEYILIYQLDAIVFVDELNRFCQYGFDYIGAPWPFDIEYPSGSGKVYYVGNGGFSLRKVESFIRIAEKISPWDIEGAEDVFWASCISEAFCVAPVEIALQFSFEAEIKMSYVLIGERFPFGCHAWAKFDLEFLKDFLCEEGYKIDKIYGEARDIINEKRRLEWERRLRRRLLVEQVLL